MNEVAEKQDYGHQVPLPIYLDLQRKLINFGIWRGKAASLVVCFGSHLSQPQTFILRFSKDRSRKLKLLYATLFGWSVFMTAGQPGIRLKCWFIQGLLAYRLYWLGSEMLTIKWEQTYYLCLGKFTLSDLKRKIWIPVQVQIFLLKSDNRIRLICVLFSFTKLSETAH